MHTRGTDMLPCGSRVGGTTPERDSQSQLATGRSK